jgi:hypothetical protein
MSSFQLSGETETPPDRRAAEVWKSERAVRLAAGEQRRIARRMQALTSQLRFSARDLWNLVDRPADGGWADDHR